MEWEVGVSRCKILYIEWINNKALLYTTENYIQYPMINHNRKEFKKRLDFLHSPWLKLWAPKVGGASLIPDRETKLPHAMRHAPPQKKTTKSNNNKNYKNNFKKNIYICITEINYISTKQRIYRLCHGLNCVPLKDKLMSQALCL